MWEGEPLYKLYAEEEKDLLERHDEELHKTLS